MTTVTLTLDVDEAAAVIASTQRSSRPFVRAAAAKMRGQVPLPLRCPVTFKTPQAETCGDFSEVAPPMRDGMLASHLATEHGYAPEYAEAKAKRAIARWTGKPAELPPLAAVDIYDGAVDLEDEDEDPDGED